MLPDLCFLTFDHSKQKLPKVNRPLAERLVGRKKEGGEGGEGGDDVDNLLEDGRFSAMFTNPDFEMDQESEEFQRLHPLIAHRDKKLQSKKVAAQPASGEQQEVGGGRGVVFDLMFIFAGAGGQA